MRRQFQANSVSPKLRAACGRIQVLAAIGVVALCASGCGTKSEAGSIKPRSRSAFFRIANFTDGPIPLTINGLPLSQPLAVGTATLFTKWRIDKLHIQMNGKDQKVPLVEPGMTMYLLGSAKNPRQLMIANDQRSTDKEAALLRVVNLTKSTVSVEGIDTKSIQVEGEKAMDPISQPTGIGEAIIKAGSFTSKQTLDLKGGKSYVYVVSSLGNNKMLVTAFETPEGMTLQTTQAAAQGG